jgi:hypothetical protein
MVIGTYAECRRCNSLFPLVLTTKPKPSQNANWGRRLARSASRRPPVCWSFLRLTALLGSVTDTLTLTGGYAYANGLKSG